MAVDDPLLGEQVGRRRKALFAGAGRPKSDPLFTMADVAAIKNDPSAATKAQIARRLGGSLDQLSTGSTRELVQGLLALLVRDVELEVRKSLADAVSRSRALPPEIAARLATDDIAVAQPVLQHSPVLDDDMLADIIRTNAMQYALAVAGREQISETLSQTLVDHGDENVVVRLVGNMGAKLSERTFAQIIQDYEGNALVSERLVARPALPASVIEGLVGLLTSKLAWTLIGENRMDPDQAELIVSAVRKRAAETINGQQAADRQRMEDLRAGYARGTLGPQEIISFLRHGDVAGFELAMALFADLPLAEVQRLAYEPDRRYLSGLCARAKFPTPHYITLRMALELAEATVTNEATHRGYTTKSLQFLQKQYERLCRNELEIDELIYGE